MCIISPRVVREGSPNVRRSLLAIDLDVQDKNSKQTTKINKKPSPNLL
jgi:hypothetical protein